MPEALVSVDEFLSARKNFVKGGDVCVKAVKGAGPKVNSWDPKERTVRFVMSAEVEDRDKDIVMQAGLDTTSFADNPQAFFNHRSSGYPVGNWHDVVKVENGRPKRTEGTLKLVSSGFDGEADRLAFHLSEGTIHACSIGFLPKTIRRRESAQPADGYQWSGYIIEEAELLECSPVGIPSNPAALAKAAAHGDVLAKETIEQILDDWVKHPETGLIVPKSEFEAAHRTATGNRTSVVQESPEAKGFFERMEALFAKAFPPDTAKIEAAARAAEAEATALADRKAALKSRLDAVKERAVTLTAE